MTRAVYLSGPAQRDLDNLDPPVRERVVSRLRRFAKTGHGDVRRLRGEEGRWRLRVGDWRVLFRQTAEDDGLLVLRVLHRGRAYR